MIEKQKRRASSATKKKRDKRVGRMDDEHKEKIRAAMKRRWEKLRASGLGWDGEPERFKPDQDVREQLADYLWPKS